MHCSVMIYIKYFVHINLGYAHVLHVVVDCCGKYFVLMDDNNLCLCYIEASVCVCVWSFVLANTTVNTQVSIATSV